ncbi:MAG: hypothetical protein ABEL51_08085 [Salinibacter sp.]
MKSKKGIKVKISPQTKRKIYFVYAVIDSGKMDIISVNKYGIGEYRERDK